MKLFYLLLVPAILGCSSNDESQFPEQKKPATAEIPRPLPMPGRVDSVPFKNCFLDIPYTHVAAYSYKSGPDGTSIVTEKGKLISTVIKENVLHPAPLKRLTMALSDPETYGGTPSDCFMPGFGIVFYRNKKILAHVSICFECNYLESTVSLPDTPNKGFSKKGAQKLKEIYERLMLD